MDRKTAVIIKLVKILNYLVFHALRNIITVVKYPPGEPMKIGVLIMLAMVALFLTGTANAATEQVLIRHFQFQPAEITINKGDTVTWMHPGPVSHTVKFADSESPILKNGGMYSKKFDQAGTFNYECGIHPYMKGTVIVK